MPQDQLTNILMNKAMSQQGPDVPNTTQAPPNGFDNGMDVLLSALGVRAHQPGNPWTGAGSLLGAAAPFLPFGKLGAGARAVEGETPTLLKQIFAANPEAETIYNRALSAQAPEALAGHVASKAGKYATNADLHDALLDLHVSDRPRLMRTETGITIPIPNEAKAAPAVQGYSNVPIQAGLEAPEAAKRLGNAAGLTPADIVKIRTLNPDQAAQLYPKVNKTVLYKIITQDIYGGVK